MNSFSQKTCILGTNVERVEFSKFNENKSDLELSIPSHCIKLTGNRTQFTFLIYSSPKNTYGQFLEVLKENSLVTRRLNHSILWSPLIKAIVIERNKVVIEVYNFRNNIENKLIMKINNGQAINLRSINNDINSIAERKHSQGLIINLIKQYLESNHIQYIKNKKSFQYKTKTNQHYDLNNFLFQINVKIDIVKFQIILDKSFDLSPKLLKDLKNHLGRLNKSNLTGRFFYENNIQFESSFHVSASSIEIQKAMLYISSTFSKLFVPQLDSFYKIIKGKSSNIETILNKTYKEVKIKLTEEQIEKEKGIYNIMLKEKSLYFKNRFSIGLTKFAKQACHFFYISDSLSTQSVLSNMMYLKLEQLIEIIEMLSSFGIFFNNNEFPLNSFKWYNEVPVYTYDQPLSSILEINQSENKKSERLIKTNESVFRQFIALHSTFKTLDIFKSDSLYYYLKNHWKFDFLTLDKEITESRLRLYKNSKNPHTAKIYEIQHFNQSQNLLVQQKLVSNILENIQTLDQHSLCRLISQVILIIDWISLKTPDFVFFDYTCFGYTHSGKLKISIKAQSEIRKDFLAPEIFQLKPCSKSLTFSFGKLLECISGSLFEPLVSACTKPSIFQRPCPSSLKELFLSPNIFKETS